MFAAPARMLNARAPAYNALGGPEGIQILFSVGMVSTLFYGMYLVLAVMALYLSGLRAGRDAGPNDSGSRKMMRSPVFVGTIALFIVITAHWVLTLVAIYDATGQTAVPPALQFYADPLPPIALARNLFLLAAWIFGDLLIVHRLWTVWHHNRLIILFPAITWLGLTASGIGQNVVSSLHFLNPAEIFPIVHGWFTSELAFTLATTVYCTAMFSYRLWSKHRQLKELGGGGGSGWLMGVLANTVESAAIYTIWITLDMAAYQTRSMINFWVFESSAAVVGIVNMLIYVRVGLGWTVTSHVGRLPTTRVVTLNGHSSGTRTAGEGMLPLDDMDSEVKSKGFGRAV